MATAGVCQACVARDGPERLLWSPCSGGGGSKANASESRAPGGARSELFHLLAANARRARIQIRATNNSVIIARARVARVCKCHRN